MDNTLFSKMELLRDFYIDYMYDPEWQDFIQQHDIGIPLSFVVVHGMAEPTKAGELAVLETWRSLCSILNIDPNEGYATIEDMMDE